MGPTLQHSTTPSLPSPDLPRVVVEHEPYAVDEEGHTGHYRGAENGAEGKHHREPSRTSAALDDLVFLLEAEEEVRHHCQQDQHEEDVVETSAKGRYLPAVALRDWFV